MNMNEYQAAALRTEQTPSGDVDPEIIPLLGLAGESGALLSEYKKYLRDGPAHHLFRERVSEELGDILWYVAVAGSKFDLELNEIAEANLNKCRSRWGELGNRQLADIPQFDQAYPVGERFPRCFDVRFQIDHEQNKVRMFAFGKPLGDPLTDNSHHEDGYRFHDVFHLAYAAVLGWSPVIRKLLDIKRRSNEIINEVEDGGRATAIEEGISALVFSYALNHDMLEGVSSIDTSLLATIRGMTSHLEISECSLLDWEQAILQGFAVWRQIEKSQGGTVKLNLDTRSLSFTAD